MRIIRYYARIFAAFAREPALRLLLLATIVVLAIGTVFYRIEEGWSWVDAFYFCTITLATIGYGDLTPTSDLSKLFTVAYVFFGIGIVATFLSVMIRAPFIEQQRRDALDAANESVRRQTGPLDAGAAPPGEER